MFRGPWDPRIEPVYVHISYVHFFFSGKEELYVSNSNLQSDLCGKSLEPTTILGPLFLLNF